MTGVLHRLVMLRVRGHRESGGEEACCGHLARHHLVASIPAASSMLLFPPRALGFVWPERVVPPLSGRSIASPF